MSAGISAPAASLDRMSMPQALNETWRAIRRRHRDVPAASVTVAPGRAPACRMIAWDSAPVIQLPAKDMTDPAAVLCALLHAAAHGLVAASGAALPPGEGRWHNAQFRDAAQRLGLAVSTTTATGWSETSVPAHTLAVYAEQIGQLATALEGWEPPQRRVTNYLPAVCQCEPPRKIRVHQSTLERGPIRCDRCGKPFEVPVTR